jgi:hypothetical protein
MSGLKGLKKYFNMTVCFLFEIIIKGEKNAVIEHRIPNPIQRELS